MGYADTSKIRSRDSFPKDPWHANTMPARYYVDPGIYEREKEAVFYSTWQLVGSVRELPDVGSYITATVIDEHIFVTRDANRRLRGYYNVCRHRAGRLVKGSGTQPNGVIACPVHGWVYDLEGRLTQARGTEELPDFDKSTICLQEIRVEEFAKFVFVNLDPGATAQVEAIIEEIHAAGTKIVMTTHDLAQARRLADEIVFMHAGRVTERAPAPSFFDGPESAAGAAFLEGRLLW